MIMLCDGFFLIATSDMLLFQILLKTKQRVNIIYCILAFSICFSKKRYTFNLLAFNLLETKGTVLAKIAGHNKADKAIRPIIYQYLHAESFVIRSHCYVHLWLTLRHLLH